MTSLERFIAAIPKAELHLHIEGTLEPELMVAIGRRNGVALPYPDAESARKAYNFSDLQSFLDIYYRATAVLITEEDFYDLTLADLKKAASQQVRHAEIFFDPQSHTARGIAFETVIRGVERALVEELVQKQVPLTVCPLSNVRLKVFSSMAEHNLKLMLQRGLCVTINSDDPAYFGGYINENYLEAAHALQLDRNDIIRLAQNSFAASSLSPLHKELYLKEIERYIAEESC